VTRSLYELRQQRIAKLLELKRLGIDPYPANASRGVGVSSVHADFQGLEGRRVTVAGRIMSWRQHGGLAFANLQDQSGTVQILLSRTNLPATVASSGELGFRDANRLLDLGDIVEATGDVTRTRTGEVSVEARSLRLLAKALRPLPDKWHGLADEELLIRHRYLDMIMNPEKRERFVQISEMLFAMRDFLRGKDFLEFHTPILQPLYGGGRARPFRTRVNALSTDFYLAIAHELYLKRLIIAGFERVYTIGRYFRNEGIDRLHNPEFSMLETMTSFEGYEFNMDLTEELYRFIASTVFDKKVFRVAGREINVAGDWRRAHMADLVLAGCGVDFRGVETLASANEILSKNDLAPAESIGHALASLFEARVAPTLIQPTIVYGHPVEISPLAKASPEDPRFVERFEVYIGGFEQGDNWSELNDPIELHKRFQREWDDRAATSDEEAHPVDLDFLEALEYGMPPTTGLGPGIERLAMLFTEADNIDDVMFFPLVRPKVSDFNRRVYRSESSGSEADELHHG